MRHVIVVIPVGHLITMHLVVTMHALVMVMHAMPGCCAMRIGLMVIVILRERATVAKRSWKVTAKRRVAFSIFRGISVGLRDVQGHPCG